MVGCILHADATAQDGGWPTQARFWLERGSSAGWTESSCRRRRSHS